MNFSQMIAAASLSLLAATSLADNGGGPLDLSSGSTFFGRTHSSLSFIDTYIFTSPGSSYLAVGSVASSAIGGQDIDFTSIEVMLGGRTVETFANNGTDAQEHHILSQTLLATGSYSLMVMGTQSLGAASYAGNLAVGAPAKGPATSAMLLAGFAVMGFISRRRQQ